MLALGVVLAAGLVPTSTIGQSSLPVFPGAEGFGSRTVAGRGRVVLRVHAKNLSFFRNLMAHNDKRHPEVKGDTSTLIVNNLIHNNRGELIDFYDYNGDGPQLATIIGNVYRRGPNTQVEPNYVNRLIYLNAKLKPGTRVYQVDNVSPLVISNNVAGFNPIAPPPPVSTAGVTIRPSSHVEAYVTANVGARPADRDPVDARIINEVTLRARSLITRPSDVGGYPSLAVNVRSLTLPSSPNSDNDADGYTNLEEWLHDLAAAVEGNDVPPSDDTSPPTVSITAPTAGQTVSSTVSLAANAGDDVGVASVQFMVDGVNVGSADTAAPYSVAWNSTGVANGTHTITATAWDAAGNQKTSASVSVSVNNTTASAPAAPVVFLPLNGATGVTNALTTGSQVRWKAAARATSYDLYFGKSSNPAKIATVTPPAGVSVLYPGTLYAEVPRASKTTYYWRIVAKNAAGSTSSPIWKFTTQ